MKKLMIICTLAFISYLGLYAIGRYIPMPVILQLGPVQLGIHIDYTQATGLASPFGRAV